MTNADIARVFEEIADMLEIKGEDAFRINSYRRVARTIDDLATDIAEIAKRGELNTLPGVGKGSAAKIQELLETGRLKLREELATQVPESVLELLRIPGMGPKKVALLWRERKIDSLDSLKRAIEAGGLDDLKGFGKKTLAQISDGIEFLRRSAGRTRLGEAWEVARGFREAIAAIKGVKRVEQAGSLRRGRETIGDLDLLCIAADGERVIKAFTQLPSVSKVIAAGETKGSVLVEWSSGHEIQIDLRVVPAESFGAAWQYFTGSKEHNIRLRERAIKRGWSLSEYSLSDAKTDKVIASREEESIYAALDLPWIPPELREDRGELEPGTVPADLLTEGDIRGDLHMHTTWSDGSLSVREMAEIARARGLAYIVITDHSQSLGVASGLKIESLRAQRDEIRQVDAEMTPGLRVFQGAEVEIRADGHLDYPDEVLAELDVVIASLHTGLRQPRDQVTARLLNAIRSPHVDIIGHPRGQMIPNREPADLDMDAVFAAAQETGTVLEINANPTRLDLDDAHAQRAVELGIKLAINTDAHSASDFDVLPFGITTARRGWVRPEDVINTWSTDQFIKWMQS
jgi:DNA polymerase (family 10)